MEKGGEQLPLSVSTILGGTIKKIKKEVNSSSSFKVTCRRNGPLAQLVELPTHDRLVVGSNPTRSIGFSTDKLIPLLDKSDVIRERRN